MIKKFNKYEKHENPGIRYYPNGQKKSEYWFLNKYKKFHKVDGPAVQSWHPNGQIQFVSWYLNGERHREDGISYQFYSSNGQIQSEYWYLNGIMYSKKDWIKELKNINSKHYKKQKMLYDVEKYNL